VPKVEEAFAAQFAVEGPTDARSRKSQAACPHRFGAFGDENIGEQIGDRGWIDLGAERRRAAVAQALPIIEQMFADAVLHASPFGGIATRFRVALQRRQVPG
jgi:hypothetical protein